MTDLIDLAEDLAKTELCEHCGSFKHAAEDLIALGWMRNLTADTLAYEAGREDGLREALDEERLARALRAAHDGLLIDAPGDDEHRWCDEDSGGNHRLDSELWLRDAAVAIAKAYREDTDHE